MLLFKKLIKRVFVIFTILFILSFSFEYNIIKINFLTSFFEKIVKIIASFFLDNTKEYTLKFYSDAAGLYLNIIVVFIISLGVSSLLFLFKRKRNTFDKEFIAFFIVGVCYYLSLQFSIYGFSKLFKYQFYDAHPNTLYTPVGYLTKDFLYWTSIGSSKLYNTITGLIEITIAVLLWFKKTRVLVCFLGIGMCLNIVLVNFSFDINVKIQSLFLLFLFLLVSYSNIKKLYLFFIKQEVTKINPISFPISKKHRFKHVVIKSVLISVILLEGLYPYVTTNSFNGDTTAKPLFYGAYEIKNNEVYKRFFIHSDPYFIIQDKNDELYSFKMELNEETLLLTNNDRTSILSFKNKEGVFYIEGDFFGSSLNIKATPIDISKLPLNEDSFKWTIDGYK